KNFNKLLLGRGIHHLRFVFGPLDMKPVFILTTEFWDQHLCMALALAYLFSVVLLHDYAQVSPNSVLPVPPRFFELFIRREFISLWRSGKPLLYLFGSIFPVWHSTLQCNQSSPIFQVLSIFLK